jgi:hypothetical protein
MSGHVESKMGSSSKHDRKLAFECPDRAKWQISLKNFNAVGLFSDKILFPDS